MASLENTSQLDLSPILKPLEDSANIAWSCIENGTLAPLFKIGITEIFTLAIGCLFFLALFIYTIVIVWYCGKYIYLGSKLRTFTKLASKTDNEEKISQQRSILKRINPYFLDSLTEYNGKLYSNQDIETFFSTKSLAPSILHSKFLPLTPILLTGLGVLGTFLGLQLGLSGLELDGDTDKLQHGIRAVAEGAAVAFATSVYGVSSSLFLNFIEKFYSVICLCTIHAFQSTLEQLFPPFPVMNVFTAIEQYNKNSDEYLGGLAEQIGLTMQQTSKDLGIELANSIMSATKDMISSLVETSKKSNEHLASIAENISATIQTSFQETSQNLGTQFSNNIDSASQNISTSLVESINASLVPAIESLSKSAKELGEGQTTSAEGALSSLIKEFSQGMRKEGEEQREAMSAISAEVKTTFNNFNDTIQKLSSNMGTLNDNLQEVLQEQRSIMDDWQKVTTQYTNATENLQNTSSNFSNASHELTTFSDNIHNTMERTADSVDNAMNVVQGVSGNYEKATESLSNTTQAFDKLQGILEETATHLANSVTVAQTDMSGIIQTLIKATEEKGNDQRISMNNASADLKDSLEKLTSSIKNIADSQEETTNKLRKLVSEHVEATKSVVVQGKTLLEDTKGVHKNFSDFASTMQKTSQNFDEASTKLNTFGSTIDKAMERTASSIDDAMDIVKNASTDYITVSSQFQETNKSFEKVTTSLESVSNTVATSLLDAQKAFALLFERYMALEWDLRNYALEIKGLSESQIEALDSHMTKLLTDYANAVNRQVKERMNEWNEQTKQYTENMIAVVQVMGELIDGLDQRPNQKR